MTAIILCDDESGVLDFIKKVLDECIREEDLPFYVDLLAKRPGEVINYIEIHAGEPSIYILDVELKSNLYTGIELGSVIRRICPESFLIYVSSHENAALLTYKNELRCFDFISKNDSELKTRITRDLKGIHKELENDIFRLKRFEYNDRIIYPDKLLYIETSKNQHRIEIHQEDSFTEVWGSLADIRKLLPDSFFPCHRSVIVNTSKIHRVSMPERKVYLQNGRCCDGSVMQLREMKKKYPEFFVRRR